MTAEYEYFIATGEDMETHRTTEDLWRRPLGSEEWEFLSFFDWEWHRAGPGHKVSNGPNPDALTPVTPERAMELAADRGRWALYWAVYRDEPRPGEKARGVVRRKYSLETGRDEAFGRDKTWARTTAIFDFHSAGPHDPPHLVPITAEEADQILFRILGVQGATAL
ncbi:hypothetical protein C3486_11970 [Streptomyces sp. Ru73]|uniref:hypothetical protein n=1 Tax=Streptomyces sp. Ru73 TaxID=2080748 RepID=UPI000CDD5157|nr:hypothetical protein [Streptomyces sp. Ru73]POX40898.1 hypothetical protein C3486_11970 [Streptomyces sp. Ru73]